MDDTPVTSVNRKCSAVTGSARKIKDNAADWHNLMLRWEKLNNEGFSAAEKIVNLRMTCSQSEQQLLVNDSSSSSPLQQQTGRANAPSAELQEECCKLQDMLDRMVAVVLKMERLLASQQGILDLEEFQFGAEGRTSPLFHSWSTKQFLEASRFLLDCYSQELRLKQTILREIAHTVTSDLCMVYLSCWLHQPFIPPQARMTLEALLLETGHRTL
ncbi:cyclin-dependent kinase 2-interacting protein isoform X2 [Thalassophryne amazonica]|uniref:cyclin-dependent kinase 2-interacting protein isoform X2 n=1 Tax=Thalassophryne amazonica TaxID=390379 RepID=UPI0014724020|nr:cyclin-dependent kinase 2-interacting protein isoform X2 [Thalassophryne amazonica]